MFWFQKRDAGSFLPATNYRPLFLLITKMAHRRVIGLIAYGVAVLAIVSVLLSPPMKRLKPLIVVNRSPKAVV